MSIRLFKSPAYKHNFFEEEKEKFKSGLSTVLKKGAKWFSEWCILEIYALRDFKTVQFAFFTILVKRTLKDDLPFFELTAPPQSDQIPSLTNCCKKQCRIKKDHK